MSDTPPSGERGPIERPPGKKAPIRKPPIEKAPIEPAPIEPAPIEEAPGGNASVFADELDKELLAQLHAATLKASDSCFEIKKLCATVLVPAVTLVSVFADKKLDWPVFLAGIAVVISFWLADSTAYYYQRTLRNQMSGVWARRAARCEEDWAPHIPPKAQINAWRAAFNDSMVFYGILAVVILSAMLLFAVGLISSPVGSGAP